MKKVFIYALALCSLFYACSDDNSDEIDSLKQQLEAEKGKTATGITFEGDKMTIVYSNGTTSTPMAIPNGVQGPKGEDGAQGPKGEDGIGIAKIDFNKDTGVLSITLTNGNKSDFSITETVTGGLTAVLIDDSKGALFLKTIYMGAVPLIENEYDADFNLTKMVQHISVNGMIMKENMVEKQYADGKLSSVKATEFATEKGIKYTIEHIDGFEVVELNDDREEFVETTGGNHYYYRFYYSSDQDKYYQKYIAYKTDKGNLSYIQNIDHKTYTLYKAYFSKEFGGQTYYIYHKYDIAVENNSSYYRESDDVVYRMSRLSYENWYVGSVKYTKTGTYQIGDVIFEETYQIECNDDNQIEKAYDTDGRHTQLSYNNGCISKIEEYRNEVTTGRYTTYAYNADKLLTSVSEFTPTNTKGTEVMKTEYDANKNPVAIYAYYDATYTNIFDPWSNSSDPFISYYQTVEQIPAGLRLLAKVEYYDFKNPLGNTAGSIWSALNNYKVNNAIKRITTVDGMAMTSIEYKEFNEYGYPRSISGNTTINVEGSVYLEFLLDYTIKTK